MTAYKGIIEVNKEFLCVFLDKKRSVDKCFLQKLVYRASVQIQPQLLL